MTDMKFEHEGLVILASRTGTRCLIAWRGVSDGRSPAMFLNPVIKQLVELAKGSAVTVDFTRLDYLNSATVAPMLSLVRSLDANEQPVLVLFADIDWQRTHLKCMSAIARTLQHVKVEGRARVE